LKRGNPPFTLNGQVAYSSGLFSRQTGVSKTVSISLIYSMDDWIKSICGVGYPAFAEDASMINHGELLDSNLNAVSLRKLRD